jgi:hypothetical protein
MELGLSVIHADAKVTQLGAIDGDAKVSCHLANDIDLAVTWQAVIVDAKLDVVVTVGAKLSSSCSGKRSRLPRFDLALYCASMRQALRPSCTCRSIIDLGFLFHPSHQIFEHMHEVLNIGKK